jgi:hypothetical protein
MRENEIGEGSLGTDVWEIDFVLRINLDAKIC